VKQTWIEDLYRIKETLRAGWLRMGLTRPESVADHSYATALLSWRLAREAGLDERRVLLMALLHDFHEARLGDVPSPDKMARGMDAVTEEERRVEAEQWEDDPEIAGLLEELRQGAGEEARLVRAVDGLELLFQARRYGDAGHPGAREIIDSVLASPAAAHPLTRAWTMRSMKNPPPGGEE